MYTSVNFRSMIPSFRNVPIVIALTLGATLGSCTKEETDPQVAKPTINLKELGLGNSHMADRGDELHIEADIVAEGKISKVMIELHNESGSGDEVEEEFTGLAGLKNAEFHDHIMIPANIAAGEYHFHMTVIDQEGQSTSIDDEVEIN